MKLWSLTSAKTRSPGISQRRRKPPARLPAHPRRHLRTSLASGGQGFSRSAERPYPHPGPAPYLSKRFWKLRRERGFSVSRGDATILLAPIRTKESPLMRKLCPFLVFALFLICSVSPAEAQAPLEPQQLPSRTAFYLIWRGSPTGEARKSNALLGLWDDPDFAPVRTAMVEALMNDSKQKKEKSGPTREEMAEYATLLDNAFTVGYLPPRQGTTAKAPAAVPGIKAPTWNGMFFVYDRTGKEALLSNAVLHMRAASKEIPKLSEMNVAGIPSL